MLGSLLGGLFGSAVSSGMQHLNNYISGLMNVGFQKELQDHAAAVNYNYAQKSSLNSPSWNRQGLENAGFNPMLAVQNATSGANSSWTSSGQAQSGLVDYASQLSNAQSFQRLANETKTAEATQDEAYANADKAKAEKNTILEKLPYVSQKEKAAISNIEKDSMHKEALIHQIDETIRLREKELELQQYLGESGLEVQRRGQDKAYNASTYATDEHEKTLRNTKHFDTGFGTGYSGYIDPDTFSGNERPTSKHNNTHKSYHWEHY